jgi:hypothetical protein
VSTGIATAEGLIRTGQEAKGDSLLQTVRSLAVAMRFNDIANQIPQSAPAPLPGLDSPQQTPVPVRPPTP